MEQIYFSDNFFFLRNRTQVLQELLELEINSAIFNTQIMEEVRNIARLLEEHEQLLNERNQLQGFAELAQQLFRIKHAFLVFMDNVIHSKKLFLQVLLQKNTTEWNKIIEQISASNEKLAEDFGADSSSDDNQGAMVSDAELEMLFQNNQELGLDYE